MSEHRPLPIPDGLVTVSGKSYMPDAKGNLTPVENVRPADKLEDETVAKHVVLKYWSPGRRVCAQQQHCETGLACRRRLRL